MGLLSKFGKDKQDSAGEDSGYYRAQDDRALNDKARSKRASSAGDAAAPRRNGRKDAADPVLPEKKRARRRLVGAIALALAVVIGLPMVLDSEPKSSVADIAINMPSKDKPGEPLNGGPAPGSAPAPALEQPAAPATVAPPVTGPGSAAATPPAAAPSTRAVAPVAAGASLDKGEEFVQVPGKSAEPAKPPKAAEPKVAKAEVKPPEPKPEPKKPEAKAEAKPEAKAAPSDDARAMAILEGKTPEAAPATKYVIKVGAFAAKDKVDELQRKLGEAGIKSYAQKVHTASGELTSVRVGPFPNKEEAEKVRAKLGKLGLNGSLTPA
jgi:DedD protein